MTFPEVFESFKNNRYLRRKSWNPKLFINLRHNVPLIRLVMFTSDKPSTDDLLADDWENINNL